MHSSRQTCRIGFLVLAIAVASSSAGAGDVLVSATIGKISRFDDTAGAFVNDYVPSIPTPHGMAIGPDCNLYVSAVDRVLRYALSTEPRAAPRRSSTGTPGTTEFVAAGAGGLGIVGGLDFGPDGNLYVANGSGNNVLRYDGTTGAFVDAFVLAGAGGLAGPALLQFGPDGDLYVPSLNNGAIFRYDGITGASKPGPLGPPGTAEFVSVGALNTPHDFDFGPDGHIYANSYGDGETLKFDGTTGALLAVVASGMTANHGLTFGPSGTFFVTSLAGSDILEFASDGTPLGAFIDGSGIFSGAAGVVFPQGCASPPAVPDGTFGTPMTAERLDAAGNSLRVRWDVSSCQPQSYHLLYGSPSGLATYALDGARCDLGATGEATWAAAPAGDLWFVLVSDDGNGGTEGSWGTDAAGAHRKGSVPSGFCQNAQRDNAGWCIAGGP